MVKTEKHILPKVFIPNMAVEISPGSLETEIEHEFSKFVDTHRTVLQAALQDDYDELPEIPDYDIFLKSLYDASDALAKRYGTDKKAVEGAIRHYNGIFYMYTLPSLSQ
jgi:hypothetical protein